MEPLISPEAAISRGVVLGPNVAVGRLATICSDVRIGADTVIGESVNIGPKSVIGSDVKIGPNVTIGRRALILPNAQICPNDVQTVSSHGRSLDSDVTVGAGVLLPDEVELGFGAIIPTQRTIAIIGHFGAKNRVVTIYGSDLGPRFSIGCQVGESLRAIKNNVAESVLTTPASAATYKPFLGIFGQIGKAVQAAYKKERRLVDELKVQRLELFSHY